MKKLRWIRLPALGLLTAASLLPSACGTEASAPSQPGPASAPNPPSAGTCQAARAADVAVASEDLNGYPPYAIRGCTLVFVDATHNLVMRDLTNQSSIILATADSSPRRPSLGDGVVAWEARDRDASVVRVRVGTEVRTVTGPFASAGEPRASGTSVAFTAWASVESGDSDVWLYDAGKNSATVVLAGPGQQRFADISEGFVAATDFAEDPDGRFDDNGLDLADIVVFDRASSAIVHRESPGKQAFPMLVSGDLLAYLEWGTVHPEPKLGGYLLRSGAIRMPVATDRLIAHVDVASTEYARPAAVGVELAWIQTQGSETTLMRAPADGSRPPEAAAGLEGLALYAPAKAGADSPFILVAGVLTSDAMGAPRLHAVQR